MDHFVVKVENEIKENEICIPTYENGTEVFVLREPYQNLQAVRLKVNNEVDIPDKQTFGCYISSMTQSKLNFETDNLGDVITVIPADLIPGATVGARELQAIAEEEARRLSVLFGEGYVYQPSRKDLLEMAKLIQKPDFAKTMTKTLLFRVVIQKGLDVDILLVKAKDAEDAFEEFWKHCKDEPNIEDYDFGNKDEYTKIEDNTYHNSKTSISLSIEELKDAPLTYISSSKSYYL